MRDYLIASPEELTLYWSICWNTETSLSLFGTQQLLFGEHNFFDFNCSCSTNFIAYFASNSFNLLVSFCCCAANYFLLHQLTMAKLYLALQARALHGFALIVPSKFCFAKTIASITSSDNSEDFRRFFVSSEWMFFLTPYLPLYSSDSRFPTIGP